jgi:hypothetical protein
MLCWACSAAGLVNAEVDADAEGGAAELAPCAAAGDEFPEPMLIWSTSRTNWFAGSHALSADVVGDAVRA